MWGSSGWKGMNVRETRKKIEDESYRYFGDSTGFSSSCGDEQKYHLFRGFRLWKELYD
jgi:hypothetical protein